ncbi:hypothetical protein Bbelb_161960 [Branchiostoma belcheri]|nr:hypothetical protein Bbelb_161960 [Branchiostoma belcheri]
MQSLWAIDDHRPPNLYVVCANIGPESAYVGPGRTKLHFPAHLRRSGLTCTTTRTGQQTPTWRYQVKVDRGGGVSAVDTKTTECPTSVKFFEATPQARALSIPPFLFSMLFSVGLTGPFRQGTVVSCSAAGSGSQAAAQQSEPPANSQNSAASR